jgi:hypothetical protein
MFMFYFVTVSARRSYGKPRQSAAACISGRYLLTGAYSDLGGGGGGGVEGSHPYTIYRYASFKDGDTF